MHISTRPCGSTTLLDLEGVFDQDIRPSVHEAIQTARNGGYEHLVFNLEEVDFMSTMAISSLVVTHVNFNEVKHMVGLLQPQGQARQALERCNPQETIKIYESEAEALADAPNVRNRSNRLRSGAYWYNRGMGPRGG